ncbi:phage holin, lambda family, partial [Pseudomonas aeruginosa]
MKMPERPETWAALLAWLSAHYPHCLLYTS